MNIRLQPRSRVEIKSGIYEGKGGTYLHEHPSGLVSVLVDGVGKVKIDKRALLDNEIIVPPMTTPYVADQLTESTFRSPAVTQSEVKLGLTERSEAVESEIVVLTIRTATPIPTQTDDVIITSPLTTSQTPVSEFAKEQLPSLKKDYTPHADNVVIPVSHPQPPQPQPQSPQTNSQVENYLVSSLQSVALERDYLKEMLVKHHLEQQQYNREHYSPKAADNKVLVSPPPPSDKMNGRTVEVRSSTEQPQPQPDNQHIIDKLTRLASDISDFKTRLQP